jgi:hypothetical protein
MRSAHLGARLLSTPGARYLALAVIDLVVIACIAGVAVLAERMGAPDALRMLLELLSIATGILIAVRVAFWFPVAVRRSRTMYLRLHNTAFFAGGDEIVDRSDRQ